MKGEDPKIFPLPHSGSISTVTGSCFLNSREKAPHLVVTFKVPVIKGVTGSCLHNNVNCVPIQMSDQI
jgi:hypothetical protein